MGLTLVDLDLIKDGITILPRYLSKAQIKSINNELDEYFQPSHLSINGYLGHTINSEHVKSLSLPTAQIKSINLLELACDIQFVLINCGINEQQVVTTLEIWQESSNPVPLFMHTDNRPGMIRGFIYLEGGASNSGAFKYVRGSHLLAQEYVNTLPSAEVANNLYLNHKIHKDIIRDLDQDLLIAASDPGTLVLAQTIGFHGNMPRIAQRRVLVFEFQPIHMTHYPRSTLFIPSNLITDKVLDNINLFRNSPERSPHYFGTDTHLLRPPTFKKKILSRLFSQIFTLFPKVQSILKLPG